MLKNQNNKSQESFTFFFIELTSCKKVKKNPNNEKVLVFFEPKI